MRRTLSDRGMPWPLSIRIFIMLLVFIAALLNPRTDIVKIIDNEDFDYLCRTVRPLAILFKSFCSDCFDSGRGNFFYNERNYF